MNASVNGSMPLLDLLVNAFETCNILEFMYIASGIVLFIFYDLCSSIVFFSYIFVFECNKKMDKIVPIYPIIKHFNTSVIYMQSVIYFFSAFIFLIDQEDPMLLDNYVPGLISVVIYFLIVILNAVQNILLFVLAVRAFFIFVFPQTWQLKIKRIFEFFVNQKFRFKYQHLIRFLYFSVASWCIGSQIVLAIYCTQDFRTLSNFTWETVPMNHSSEKYNKTAECQSAAEIFFMNCYVSTDLLVLSSSISYFFVFLKIRKLPKQESPMKTKPEKFIIYQTIIIIFAKILVVPSIYKYYLTSYTRFFIVIFLADVVTTPFIIQVSYLFCNQSGLGKIWSLQLSKFRRFLLYVFRDRSAVRPS